MYKLKGILLFLFTSVLVFKQAYAYSCKEIQNNLFALEHKYQSATLEDCDPNGTKQYCKKASDPDSQKTIFQAQIEYNEALAKVNILEGLIAISVAVENDHAAMKTVEPTDLANAKVSINNFLMSFNRANLLSQSLNKSSDGEYFWKDYTGTNTDYTQLYIKNKCADGAKYKEFCDNVKAQIEKPHFDSMELYKTLHNFVNADNKINYQDQAREDNYKKYQEYLMFTSEDGTSVPLSKLEESGTSPSEISKVYELQKHIVDYEKNKDPIIAAKIVKVSNELKDIKMSYGEMSKLDNTNVDVQDNFKKNFESNLTIISSAAGVLTGEDNIKKNLNVSLNSLEIELDSKEKYILETLKDTASKIPGCDPKSADDMNTCLKTACGTNYPSSCSSNIPGVAEIAFHQMRKYNNSDRLRDVHKEMIECMNDTDSTNSIYQGLTTPERKQKCMDIQKEKIKDLIGTDTLQDAKKKLEATKRTLDNINQGENIKDILAEKFVTIKMLKSNNCVNKNNEVRAGDFNSFCDVQLMNIHSQTALKLVDDVGSAMLKYNTEVYKDFLESKGRFAKGIDGKTHYQKMIDDCNADKNSSSVCKYFIAEEKKRKEREKRKIELERRRQQAIINARKEYEDDGEDVEYDEGRSAFSYAMGGLATGVVQNMPGLFGYFQTRRMHEHRKNYWDNQLNMHNYYYGSGANHHTYNLQVNYDDWYSGHNVFNPGGQKYFSPQNSLFFPNFAPASFTSNNGELYIPATNTNLNSGTNPTGFSF